ncbi:tyrosine-type recombinase/integrase [Methylobacterium persicinum]|uniref:Integrase n=1 Tax=Methylobacterium persicinum TaxID=374426 RepID=A0ABU0HRL4_9HYPH|nr:tyrosine-type recombinase/integrase [Methylobacterium persicinum]MDQ0444340.1 integrase [Methylobacterium persicinum]GJE36228.1 hypothetical protein KHHGKMAE_0275 [Methylobacterium persicinum]
MQTATQIRDHLRAFVDRERSARIARLQRDLNPPRAPLIGDWSSLMEKREQEYRIFGRLQALAAEEGFDTGYDSELDNRLKREGFSPTERGAIRRRIESGYLRDLGRPDETGRLTPPRAYLQTMLTSMNEPLTEAGLNRCLRGLAALSGHVSREFASTYAEARADPREAWANLSAMRANGEVPRDTLGWAKSDFDGADSFEWGDFEVEVPAPSQQAMDDDERSNARQTEPASSPTPEQDPVPGRRHQTSAAPTPPQQRHSGAPEHASETLDTEAVNESEKPVENATIGTEVFEQEGLNCKDDQTETTSDENTNSLTEIVEQLIGHKGKTWDEKTRRQHRAVSKMLTAIAGTDVLGEIKHAHCVAYVQNLSNLPKSYGKSQRDAELSIADLLERGKRLRAAGEAEKVGLSPATVNRHITQLSTILKYCRANQRPIGEVELLRDFRLIDPQRDGDKRPAFEVEDVERLFAHPVWTSTASEVDMRQIASQQQIFAAVYWLPLLGYYTCARLSELTYLEIGDVDVTRGTLKIRPTRRRRLKNAASQRTLPIHPELIRLGFLDFVQRQSGKRTDLIFSEIERLGENTPLSNLFDKRWSVVLDQAVSSAREEGKTFHSFRHLGNMEMILALVLDPIRESMMGHEGTTVNSRHYKKTLKPEKLQTAIASIPEVTWSLKAYDWSLLGKALTEDPPKARAARPRGARRTTSSGSPRHALRKDCIIVTGRSPRSVEPRPEPSRKLKNTT